MNIQWKDQGFPEFTYEVSVEIPTEGAVGSYTRVEVYFGRSQERAYDVWMSNPKFILTRHSSYTHEAEK